MITWKLKKSSSYRRGHPWIMARDLEIDADRVEPGSFIRIVNEKHETMDFGYGNPKSALAFRSLPLLHHPKFASIASVGPGSADFQNWVVEKISEAWDRRLNLGFQGSYRVVFSETDSLPGLILDVYELAGPEGQAIGQVLAAQVLTAGFERIWGDGVGLMQRLVAARATGHAGRRAPFAWEQTIVVERKDVNIRKLEGMDVKEPAVIHWGSALGALDLERLRHMQVLVAARSVGDAGCLVMEADLFEGQKTGFFLDQTLNMQLVLQILEARLGSGMKSLRVLDLCSYVGHWSLQLGHFAKKHGLDFKADLLDVSGDALSRASSNLKRAGLESQNFELDVLKDTAKWPKGPYDVIIADPPAFVKAKKDLPQGLHAYLKLNTEAAKLVAPGGLLISCSCSGAVSEQDLADAVGKAVTRVGRKGLILGRGQQGWDHPWSVDFPEGRYLKMQITQID